MVAAIERWKTWKAGTGLWVAVAPVRKFRNDRGVSKADDREAVTAVSVPRHSEWKKFKDTFGISKNAVGSVNVGKELDKYHNGLSRDFKKNAVNAGKLSDKLSVYIKKISKKSIKKQDYTKFKSAFTTKYLLMANRCEEEMKSMGGELDAYAGRVRLMNQAARKLKPGCKLTDLQKFRQGPLRGQLAAATQVKKFDPKDLVKLWKPIDDIINKLPGDANQITLDKVARIIEVTEKRATVVAKKSGLQV